MMIESFTCLQCDETMIDNHMTSFLLAGSEPVVLVVLACEWSDVRLHCASRTQQEQSRETWNPSGYDFLTDLVMCIEQHDHPDLKLDDPNFSCSWRCWLNSAIVSLDGS